MVSVKLKELAIRAASINKELLKEEMNFIEAVSNSNDISLIKGLSDKILLLNRKETLYLQLVEKIIQKTKFDRA